MLLSKYMSLMNRLQARRAETGDLGDMVGPSFVQQKRYKSPMQSRSGESTESLVEKKKI